MKKVKQERCFAADGYKFKHSRSRLMRGESEGRRMHATGGERSSVFEQVRLVLLGGLCVARLAFSFDLAGVAFARVSLAWSVQLLTGAVPCDGC